MNYPEKFKQGFVKDIEKELNKCEIIYNPNTKGIWFVNREEKYWYLEYKVDTNYLWWRYEFFKSYTDLFSMDDEVFNEVISEWVENKLNGKVDSIGEALTNLRHQVEETLNCKVLTTSLKGSNCSLMVEETLNCRVLSTTSVYSFQKERVEETLNCKVLTTQAANPNYLIEVEETLNCKVLTTGGTSLKWIPMVEDTLN